MVKNKKLLKIISALCILSMAATLLCAAPASAASEPAATPLKGDVNNDGIIDITDVTCIQFYLAEMMTLDSTSLEAADVNFNNEVDIMDATKIQMYLMDSITCFNGLKDTKWTSLSTASTKTIRFQEEAPKDKVKVTIASGCAEEWLTAENKVSATGKVEGIKLTTEAYTSTTQARSATVTINLEGQKYKVAVKQLPQGTGEYQGNCYAYAMQLEVDPRSDSRELMGPIDPGKLSGIEEYSSYRGQDFTYLKNKNYLEDFKNIFCDRVKADLETLGWGFIKKESAEAEVNEGDWLVCLIFNPAEYIKNDKEEVEFLPEGKGKRANSTYDYHWYRRTDNGDGFTWSNKPGTKPVETLKKNKTPEDSDPANHCDLSLNSAENEYNEAMEKYFVAYQKAKNDNDYGDYWLDPDEFENLVEFDNFDNNKLYLRYYSDDGLSSYCFAYYLIGYYEVGPNAF